MQSESIAKLAEAIAKAQSELKPVKKEQENPFFRSKYADLASVWEALKPFQANGIAIVQSPSECAIAGHIALDTQLTHTSGEWMRSTLYMPLAKHDPQGVGSAITYARRYALGCMTGVVTEEDDDGNAASQPPATPAKAYTAAKAASAKKIAELRGDVSKKISDVVGATKPAAKGPSITDEEWENFLDYVGDDPDRTNVGKQLKDALAIGSVADLKGQSRADFMDEFEKSCKDLGVSYAWGAAS